MEPDHVEPLGPADGAAQSDGVSVLDCGGLDVLYDLRRTGPGGAVSAIDALLVHGQDGHLGRGLHAALGVGGLAGVLAAILREHLVDDHGGGPVFVLDLHDLVGGDGLTILHPGDLGVGVPLDLDLELESRPVLDGEVRLESSEE